MTNEEMIEILGGIRACYNIFDEWDRGKYHALSMAIEALKSQKHGRWIFNPKDAIEMMFTLPKCSECGAESPNGGNYCRNCGARMDGERREDEAD